MNAMFMIEPGEETKVRFCFADGSYITVHVKGDELRACGSAPLLAGNVKGDVIGITRVLAPAGG